MLVGANSNPWGHDPLDSGAAYLFERQIDGTWLQVQKFEDSAPPFVDQFGSAVALEGDRLMIGARGHESESNSPGAVYIYELDGTWQQVQRLDGEADGDRFGYALDFEGERAVIAAPGKDAGVVYTYRRDNSRPLDSAWQEVSRETAPDGVAGDGLGQSVDLDGDRFVAGAVLAEDSAGNPRAGAVYHFERSGPVLWAPHVAAAASETVRLPIHLDPYEEILAGTSFSIDYDEDCLFFDATDADADGMPDGVQFSIPANANGTVFTNLSDGDGEIDIVVAGALATLPAGPLLTVDLLTTCTPMPGASIVAAVAFGDDPAPSFSDSAGQSVPGSDEAGSIRILPGVRGDCNADGVIDVADTVSCELEALDFDGTSWLDVPGSTFLGDPVGCDANADRVIDVADLTCKNRLICGLECGEGGGGRGITSGGAPTLVLPDRLVVDENGIATLTVRLDTAGHAITGLLFGLEWDTARFSIEGTDTVRFVGSPASTRRALVDPEQGLLRILSADLVRAPRPLAAGTVLEIDVRLVDGGRSAGAPFVPSALFPVSFATPDGSRLEGGWSFGIPLFADGFESGDANRWSATR